MARRIIGTTTKSVILTSVVVVCGVDRFFTRTNAPATTTAMALSNTNRCSQPFLHYGAIHGHRQTRTRTRTIAAAVSLSYFDEIFSDCIDEANFLPKSSKEQILHHLTNSGILPPVDGNENHSGGDEDVDVDNKGRIPYDVADLHYRATADSNEGLLLLAKDFFKDRPEVFASLLISDFNFPPLVAHQTRALTMSILRKKQRMTQQQQDQSINDNDSNGVVVNGASVSGRNSINVDDDDGEISIEASTENHYGGSPNFPNGNNNKNGNSSSLPIKFSDKEFRSTVVNEKARNRRKKTVAATTSQKQKGQQGATTAAEETYNYGLPRDYESIYPKLSSELDEYYIFMTQPTTYSQESPIRDATAKVYLNHAKLFLGWWTTIQQQQHVNTTAPTTTTIFATDTSVTRVVPKNNDTELSLFVDIIPNQEKDSVNDIIRFVLWLRSRDVSVSYEANVLRGIIKLLKFRFARESNSDPLDGKNTFDDIQLIKEVRKLHRDANQRQRLAPRSSDETKKWISWEDYLRVTQCTRNEVLQMIEEYESLSPSKRHYRKKGSDNNQSCLYSSEQIKIAEAYQRYLILAFFASIPDRQRTIRELEVGRTLLKDNDSNCWVVKHGPNDYKTGKHYGERPAMQLAEGLTPAIDDFIEHWRPALHPSTNMLLVQSRTGNPMTANSIFKRVVRCCFKYTGKSVNPHLLRDIIVTHVRETDASEKELEGKKYEKVKHTHQLYFDSFR